MAAEDMRALRAQAITHTSLVGALCNLLLALGKLTAGYWGHSQALIADGVHSLSDLATDVLVWVAGRKANTAPDADHPYGHERYETLATLVLGVFLAAVGIGIGWDAIERVLHPEALLHPEPLALAAAAGSIVINELLFWYTLAHAKRVGSELLRANAWHHRSDAISSIVVLIGIGGTLLGLDYLDAVAAVLVALMILRIAWNLGHKAVRELVDTGLEPARVAAIKQAICTIAGVKSLHKLRTRTYGGRVSLDVHILVEPYLSVSEAHLISVHVEQQLKQGFDDVTDIVVHIDPEDDEQSIPTLNLPLRSAVVQRMNQLGTTIPAWPRLHRVVLHYLDGGVELELFLPLVFYTEDPAAALRLSAQIRATLTADPLFRQVWVYFG